MLLILTQLHATPAVVPIFVNAGTAILPAIIAPLAAAAANILRPKELLRTLRAHPAVFGGTFLCLLLACGGFTWWYLADSAPKGRSRPGPAAYASSQHYDWQRFAS